MNSVASPHAASSAGDMCRMVGQRRAQRGADHEQRDHLATDESRTEGDHREHQFQDRDPPIDVGAGDGLAEQGSDNPR